MKLDKSVASRLPLAADKDKPDVIYFDRALPGFGLRIRGRKRTFIVQYRCCAGKTRRLLLGAETDKFNVTEARKAADTVLAKVKLGHDPQGEKAAARTKDKDQKTFGAIVDMYLEDKRGAFGGGRSGRSNAICGRPGNRCAGGCGGGAAQSSTANRNVLGPTEK